jgi:predicted ArsR family transcriptional regulator
MCPAKRENSVRERILILLKKKGALSIADLAREMHLTSMAMRQHLFRLEHRGLVDHTTRGNKSGRSTLVGRPVYLYHLTEEGEGLFPRGYENFLLDTFEAIEHTLSPAQITEILKWRSERVMTQAKKYLSAHEGLHRKLHGLKAFFEHNGDLLEIEDGDRHYRLKIFHCSIHKIAAAYNEICSYEQQMLATLLGKNVSLEGTLVQKSAFCTFSVQHTIQG